MRSEEENLAAASSSSSTPPDHLRCTRSDGKKWRCKGLKLQGRNLCEKHYNYQNAKHKGTGKRKVRTTEQVVEGVDQTVRKRSREIDYEEEDDEFAGGGIFCSSEGDEEEDEDEEEQVPLVKKSRNCKKTSEIKGIEKYDISELLSSLKKSPAEFDMVEKFLRMREDKLIMEKDEAEKQVVHLKEELGIFETMCGQLSSELEEKKREIGVVLEKVGELEINSIGVQDEIREYQRVNDELKERVASLEKELEVVGARERQSQERVTKMNKDQDQKLMDLEFAKKRADVETEYWRKKAREFEIQLSPGSRRVNMDLRGLLAKVSQVEGGNKSETRQARLVNETGHGFNISHLSNVKVKEEAPEHFSPGTSVAEKASESGARQTTIHGETSSALNSPRSPSVKIEKEPLNCDGKVFPSVNAGFICSPSPRKSGVSQLAEQRKESECRQTKVGIEAGCASSDAKLSSIKVKDEPLNCGESLYTSDSVTSICHSTAYSDVKELSPSKLRAISLEQSERKESESRQSKFQVEASSALSGAKLSGIKIKEEGSVKESTPPRQKLLSLQQSEQKGNAAEQTPTEHFEISGTQSRNPTPENGHKKEGKEIESNCDGISSFLSELRRLKANNLNLKGVSVPSGLKGA